MRNLFGFIMLIAGFNVIAADLGEESKYLGIYKGSRGFLKPCYLEISLDEETRPNSPEIKILTFKRKSRFVSGLSLYPYPFKNYFENLSSLNPIVIRDDLQTNFTRGFCRFFDLNCEEGWREHQIIADAKKSISEYKYVKNDIVLLHCKKMKKIK